MRTWLVAAAVGALSLTSCGTATANRDAPQGVASTSTQATPSAVAGQGTILFQDHFDDDRNKWGIIDDPVGGTTSYAAGDYVWKFKGSIAHWVPEVLGQKYDRAELHMRDVAVLADLTITSGGGVAGVGCRVNKDTDADYQWYEFVVRDGFAAIRQSDVKGNIQVLAQTDKVSVPLGKAFTVEGVCVNDAAGKVHLTMNLNGTPILETERSDPLTNGVPSLQAWTHPMHAPMEIHWHDFSVRAASV